MNTNSSIDPNLKRSQQFDSDERLERIEMFIEALRNNKMDEFRRNLESEQSVNITKENNKVTIKELKVLGPTDNPEVPIRIYSPKSTQPDTQLPILLYTHGGSHSTGSPKHSDDICIKIADNVNCVVVSVDYRLAPEHRFPAAIDDTYAALEWLSNNASEIQGDKNKIAVAGHSSGGNLAATLALMARDRDGPKIIYQLLLFPSLDNRAYKTLTHRPRQYADIGRAGWEAYTGKSAEDDSISPYACAARAEDLSNLPPAYVLVADLDFVRDAGINYSLRLMQAGVPSELHIFPNTDHLFDMLPNHPSSSKALKDYTASLKAAFN